MSLEGGLSNRPEGGEMIVIRFDDTDTKRRALGFLAGRFSFKSWATGEMAVPEAALAHLATAGIAFSVEGPATYERLISSAVASRGRVFPRRARPSIR